MFTFILFVNLSLVDSFYEYRHLNCNYLKQAKEQLEKSYKEGNKKIEILWRLSRVYFKWGDISEKKIEKLKWYSKGKNIAEEMKKKFPHNAESYFWYAVNIGRIAELKGILNSISLAPVVKSSLEKNS